MNSKIILIATLLVFAAGCGGGSSYESTSNMSTSDKHTPDYIGLQLAWDMQTLEDQITVCLNIQEDPSIVATSAIENNIDPDISEVFFNEVCP